MATKEKKHRARAFFLSLPGRMIVSTLVATLILGTLLVGSLLFLSMQTQEEFFTQGVREETQALAESVGRNHDVSAVRNTFANALRSHGLVYLELSDAKTNGGVSLKMAKTAHLKFLQDTRFGSHDDDVYYLSEPIRNAQGNVTGLLKAGYDELVLAKQEKHMVHRSMVFSLVYVWALLLIAASLALRLTNPLKVLQKACREIASGRIDKKLNVESNISEIADLGNDLEYMRQELLARNKQIAASEARYVAILDNAAEGIFTFDKQGVIHSFNRSAEKLFGYRVDEVIGREITLLIPPPNAIDRREGYVEHFMRTEITQLIGHEGEVTGYHKDGASFHMALKVSLVMLEDEEMYTALAADISERKALIDRLKAMAEHDGLTGLHNRSYFQNDLERLVELTKRNKQSSALFYIDLDHFKYVNDALGHAAGDRLLMEISTILVKRARKTDLIARLGGDEFTVLLHNIPVEEVHSAAESFRRALADYPFRQGAEQVDIGCSIGVAIITEETQSAGEALSHADISCHLAKRGGRNRVHIFNPTDEVKVTAMSMDMGWSRRIKDAIETSRFVLACQPIVATQNGEIESYEVLIRMLDEHDALIMPGAFLPAAERFGLAKEIDMWVIVNAIETLAEQREHTPGLRYSLNLSGQTFSDPSISALIQDTLRRTELDAAALTFEVTETVAISDMSLAGSFLSSLQQIGCKTALDDFGAGMSSFAYLRDLPVDYVKLDGRFVKNMATNPIDEAMVKAMNEIAHALGKQTIAEFVEGEATMKLLKEYGIDYAQGYYLGRPDVVLPCKAISDHAGLHSHCLISSAIW